MVATLERRIARLETTPSPPPDHGDGGDDGPPPWWGDAPIAVRRYFLAIDAELVAADVHRDADAVRAWLAEHHPLWRDVWQAADQASADGAALRRIQYKALHGAFFRLRRGGLRGGG